MKSLNLYIHIPYCKARCRFCNFYVVAGRTPHLPLYFKALQNELSQYGDLKDYEIKTIYFGGGTPSLVNASSIAEIIDYIKHNFNISADLEISLEANPENITEDKLESYYNTGVNRLSIGLQAWQNNILKYLGRLYTNEQFLEKIQIVKNSKISNFNIDLILGIPGQTIGDWEETLDNVINLNPAHISCYSLEIDERSIFGKLEEMGKFKRLDESIDRKMYELALEKLQDSKYTHYEISNWAKSGFECNHNLNIWNGEEYIGLGASAFSYFKNKRYNNVFDIDKYVINSLKNIVTKENIEEVDQKRKVKEYILLHLRLTDGINFEEYFEKLGERFEVKFDKQIAKLQSEKLIEIKSNSLTLTKKGLDLENQVAMEFI